MWFWAGRLHPLYRRKRLRGPGQTLLRALYEVPEPEDYRFRLRVSAWMHTPPPPHDRYAAPYSTKELRLAPRLARQLHLPWEEEPLVGLSRELPLRIRWLHSTQSKKRRGVIV